MSLVTHAENELRAIGQYDEDPEFAQSLVDAVGAFATYGHSGGSAAVGISMLHELLQFKPLGPITSNPDEWMDVADYSAAPDRAEGVWQSRRSPTLFSFNGGKTWYDLDDPRWSRRLRGWYFRRQVRKGKV